MNGVKSSNVIFFFFCPRHVGRFLDIMARFREFHGRGSFEKSINATFISLIPKIASVVDIQDFHLVNLVGVVF